jgi:hypothetical protein
MFQKIKIKLRNQIADIKKIIHLFDEEDHLVILEDIKYKENHIKEIDAEIELKKMVSILKRENSINCISSSITTNSNNNNTNIQYYIPYEIDFSNLRGVRQDLNNTFVFNDITNKDIPNLLKNCNKKELDRILGEENITLDNLLDQLEDNIWGKKFLAKHIAINASRQGSKDEQTQIQICNQTALKFGITIKSLPNNEVRPCKNGTLVSKEDYKKIVDKNSCLKSFDAEIIGKLKGYVFAKVVFGNGGHQDNVFEEAHNFCEWVSQFGNEEYLYVVLIDTDLTNQFNNLKEKFKNNKNILVSNHINFQNYIIDRFS